MDYIVYEYVPGEESGFVRQNPLKTFFKRLRHKILDFIDNFIC